MSCFLIKRSVLIIMPWLLIKYLIITYLIRMRNFLGIMTQYLIIMSMFLIIMRNFHAVD